MRKSNTKRPLVSCPHDTFFVRNSPKGDAVESTALALRVEHCATLSSHGTSPTYHRVILVGNPIATPEWYGLYAYKMVSTKTDATEEITKIWKGVMNGLKSEGLDPKQGRRTGDKNIAIVRSRLSDSEMRALVERLASEIAK